MSFPWKYSRRRGRADEVQPIANNNEKPACAPVFYLPVLTSGAVYRTIYLSRVRQIYPLELTMTDIKISAADLKAIRSCPLFNEMDDGELAKLLSLRAAPYVIFPPEKCCLPTVCSLCFPAA